MFVTRGTREYSFTSIYLVAHSKLYNLCSRKLGHACMYLAGSDFTLYSDQFFSLCVYTLLDRICFFSPHDSQGSPNLVTMI